MKITQTGQALLNVLGVLGLIAIFTVIIAEQVSTTHKFSTKARVRSAMSLTESKVRALLLQPSTYTSCTADNQCDIRPGIFDNIDPSGLSQVSFDPNVDYDKVNGKISVKIKATDASGVALTMNSASVQMQIPPNVAKAAYWTCPDDTPFFRGFDQSGNPRCEKFLTPYCDPIGNTFAGGFDANTMFLYCRQMQSAFGCSSNQYMSEYVWYGGQTTKGTSYDYTCAQRKNPFTYFNFTPKFEYGGATTLPEIPYVATPKPADSTLDIGPPTTLPPDCSCWGPIIAMQGGGCTNLRPGANPFQCSAAEVGKQIFQCQQCQDAGKSNLYKAVAVRTCGGASNWTDLNVASATCNGPTTPDHFCCQGDGQVVLDGKDLCCKGATTQKKYYICGRVAGGPLELQDPPVGSSEYLQNLLFQQQTGYNVTSCR